MSVSGEIVNIIQTVGFPIAVAGYLLIKGSQDSKALKNAVESVNTTVANLSLMIQKLIDRIDSNVK